MRRCRTSYHSRKGKDRETVFDQVRCIRDNLIFDLQRKRRILLSGTDTQRNIEQRISNHRQINRYGNDGECFADAFSSYTVFFRAGRRDPPGKSAHDAGRQRADAPAGRIGLYGAGPTAARRIYRIDPGQTNFIQPKAVCQIHRPYLI